MIPDDNYPSYGVPDEPPVVKPQPSRWDKIESGAGIALCLVALVSIFGLMMVMLPLPAAIVLLLLIGGYLNGRGGN